MSPAARPRRQSPARRRATLVVGVASAGFAIALVLSFVGLVLPTL